MELLSCEIHALCTSLLLASKHQLLAEETAIKTGSVVKLCQSSSKKKNKTKKTSLLIVHKIKKTC